jgi:enolase
MTYRVQRARMRGILDSRGRVAPEAELRLAGGAVGTASCPRAIAAGRRELALSPALEIGTLSAADDLTVVLGKIQGTSFHTQHEFDALLEGLQAEARAGADVALALSLAFARACAQASGQSLFRYMCGLANVRPAIPHPLVNVFSGGIHGGRDQVPFQQIMIVPEYDTIESDIRATLTVYDAIERRAAAEGRIVSHSASSGLLVGEPYEALLEQLRQQLQAVGMSANVAIGLDVAAEHLKRPDGRYQFAGRLITGEELAAIHRDLVGEYPIRFLEDPFDPDDVDLWRSLATAVAGRAWVIGDDLFATNVNHIAKGLASGILLKMNQIGTLTGTLRAAEAARNAGMILCVSHRSGETEDTAMCDLAVALGARFIKIGGPRRGDRTAKYNQLLRLAEELRGLTGVPSSGRSEVGKPRGSAMDDVGSGVSCGTPADIGNVAPAPAVGTSAPEPTAEMAGS